jgi:hypothetical protein
MTKSFQTVENEAMDESVIANAPAAGRRGGLLQSVRGRLDVSLIIAAFAAVTASYVAHMLRIDDILHSDIATEILYGREMFRLKTLIPPEYYQSTEIFLIRTPMFIAFWSIFTDSMMTAFKLSVLTDVSIHVASFVYMARKLGLSKPAVALGLLANFGLRTYASGEFVGFAGASYSTMCATAYMTLGYYAALRRNSAGKFERGARFLIPFLAFMFGVSSPRLFLCLFFPLFLAHCAMKLWSRLPQDWSGDRVLRQIALWNILAVAGIVVFRAFIHTRGFGPVDVPSRVFNGLEFIVTSRIPRLSLELFAFIPVSHVTLPFHGMTLEGWTGLLLTALVIVCVRGALKADSPVLEVRGTVLRFFVISLALTALATFLIREIYAAQHRYLFLGYGLLGLAVSVTYDRVVRSGKRLSGAFLALCCSVFVLNAALNISNIPDVVAESRSRFVVRHAAEIEESLSRHGVKTAYSI